MRTTGPTLRPIGALWAVLSMLVGTTALFSFMQPVWIISVLHIHMHHVRSVHVLSHGPMTHCARTLVHPQPGQVITVDRHQCNHYGDVANYLHNLPCASWRVGAVMFGIGSFLLFLLGLISLPTVCCNAKIHNLLTNGIGRLQAFSVLLLVGGLVCLPFGLDAASLECGPDARPYGFGQCKMGWAFALGIMSTLLAIFCPLLARYTTFDPDNMNRGSDWSLLSNTSWPTSLDEHTNFKREFYV